MSNRGVIRERALQALELLSECRLCPRRCGVNRLKGERGFCKTGRAARVSSFGPHFGEEPPLVGNFGSGTIFFSHCNMACKFCQNYSLSQLGEGHEVTSVELANAMIQLQKTGCHNINLVTPTHVVPQILEALQIAIPEGLRLPLVYNCGGYESPETLKILKGLIEIYMPDAKYGDEETGRKLSSAPDYPHHMKLALIEMHRQVGDLLIDENGVAKRGLLIRHLILPGKLDNTEKIMRFIAEDISKDSYVNIMDQYRPCYLAERFPDIARNITPAEYNEAIDIAQEKGLHRGFQRAALSVM